MQKNNFFEQLPVLLALGFLLGGCVLIITPFATTLLWAAILSFTTRHIYWWINRKLGNRPWLSATIMVTTVISLIIVPLIFGLIKITNEAMIFSDQLKVYLDQGTAQLPEWISHLPLAGDTITQWWDKLITGDADVKQQFNDGLKWSAALLVQLAKITGQGFGLLLLSCILSLFFYVGLEEAAAWLHGIMRRISPTQGTTIINIVGNNIEGVVIGITGTVLVQGLLAGIGYAIAGVPGAAMLGFATVILSLFPFGHALIWIPAALMLHHQGETGWAWFLVGWGMIVIGMSDNFVKPLLIGQKSKLPLLLIIVGMVGGAFNFGVLGVFIGPTLLAVAYALLREWALDEQLS